jgi:hypothetical protein
MHHLKVKISFAFLLILLSAGISLAQIQIVPVIIEEFSKSSSKSLREESVTSEPLTLPFWDDFSTSAKQPNPELWQNSNNVYIADGIAIKPPTVNVATLDGWDESGKPYSSNEMAVGLADVLTSQPINLEKVAVGKRNTVFLSFFWQLQGLGERPDRGDSIRLQYKNVDNVWETIWKVPRPNIDIEAINGNDFFQEVIPVSANRFFHTGFQFRFQSFSRLSGNFDNWHLDYIYLNQDRNSNDISYFDRAINSLPTSIFNNYHAIPINQFLKKPDTYLGQPKAGFANLEKSRTAIQYSVHLRNAISKDTLLTLNDNSVLEQVLGYSRLILLANEIDQQKLLPYLKNLSYKDSLWLEAKFSIVSGDKWLIDKVDTINNVDVRVNDKVTKIFKLHDYFAYDDGTAEAGAGINQRGGRIAYAFILSAPDTLTHIDINFPTIGKSQDGAPMRLMVWRDLSNRLEDVLHAQSESISGTNGINSFSRYTLSAPLVVKDTIYIGFEQQSNDFVAVGLDRNTNTGDRIFYNTGSTWRQNDPEKGVAGSLMIRPRFARNVIITSVSKRIPEDKKVLIYPNPNQGKLNIQGNFTSIKIYDSRGTFIKEWTNIFGDPKIEINLTNLQKGLYFVHILNSDQVQVEKILLNK